MPLEFWHNYLLINATIIKWRHDQSRWLKGSVRKTYTGRTVVPVRMKWGETAYPKYDFGEPSLTIGTFVSILNAPTPNNPQNDRITANIILASVIRSFRHASKHTACGSCWICNYALHLFTVNKWAWPEVLLIPMTHAPETGAENRLFFRRRFLQRVTRVWWVGYIIIIESDNIRRHNYEI